MNSRLISLNGNAGAFVNVVATLPCTRLRFQEDDAAARTGIQYKSVEDGLSSTNILASTAEPLEIPTNSTSGRRGAVQGYPAQGQSGAFNFRAADTILSVRGNAVGATTLRVEEYE